MTKFEQIGVSYQYDAQTKEEANRSFKYSCNCCCNRGMHISCDHCAIECVHNLVIASFESKNNDVK